MLCVPRQSLRALAHQVPAAESVTGGSRLVLPFFTLGVEADFRAARKAHADLLAVDEDERLEAINQLPK